MAFFLSYSQGHVALVIMIVHSLLSNVTGTCFMLLGQISVGLYSRKVKATDLLAVVGQTVQLCCFGW